MTPTNLMKLIHLISSINKNGTLIILKFEIIIALHKTGFRQGNFFFVSFFLWLYYSGAANFQNNHLVNQKYTITHSKKTKVLKKKKRKNKSWIKNLNINCIAM